MRMACALLLFLCICCPAHAAAAWKIELVSGGTLDANSCRIEKGRIYLGYPVGEASFPVSEVKAIFQEAREVAVFQEKGVPQARECPACERGSSRQAGKPAVPADIPAGLAPAAQASLPGSPAAKGRRALKPKFTPETLSELLSHSVEVQTSKPVEFDPEAEEIIGGLECADEARQTELEKKMNKLFEK